MYNFHKKEAPLLGLQGSGGGLGFLTGGAASGHEFPTSYQNLINNYSAANTRYYDPVNGNDSNNGQTQATAKQNVGTDMNSWLDGANGRIAVLLPGSHHVTPHGPGSYGSRICQWNTNSVLLGAPGEAIVTNANTSARDMHIFGMKNGNAAVIGVIFNYDNHGRGTNYTHAMWGYDANATSGDVYNCVINNISNNGELSQIYDNQNGGDRWMTDCLIKTTTMNSSYTCGSQSAYNMAFTNGSSNFCGGTNSNFVHNVNTGNAPNSGLPYYLTNASNSSYGVYRGSYAWPS